VSVTATTHGARDHARAQAGARAEAMRIVPAPDGAVWAETVAGGGYTSKVLARGTTLRLTDLAGDACAHVLLYNADQPWERLSVADTVKVPWQAYLSTGHPLLSDQGRVLATIVDDTSARHDAICGAPAARAALVVAAAKHGLGPRDVAPTVAFFEGVRVEPDGKLCFTGSAGPARHVELRAELPLVVLIANAAHPLDPREDHTCSMLEVRAWRGAPTAPEDPLWTSTPELERAFLNTADYADARGI
jgi:uncharacterized protein YcgI (DUF1989 family)